MQFFRSNRISSFLTHTRRVCELENDLIAKCMFDVIPNNFKGFPGIILLAIRGLSAFGESIIRAQ